MTPGTKVRAMVPLARPRPDETAEVIDKTPSGDIRLRLPDTDYIAHAKPEHLEAVPDDLDTDPL